MTKKRSTARRLTAKGRVLARWPEAYSSSSFDLSGGCEIGYNVWTPTRGRPLGQGETAKEAWADAASRLPKAGRGSKP